MVKVEGNKIYLDNALYLYSAIYLSDVDVGKEYEVILVSEEKEEAIGKVIKRDLSFNDDTKEISIPCDFIPYKPVEYVEVSFTVDEDFKMDSEDISEILKEIEEENEC